MKQCIIEASKHYTKAIRSGDISSSFTHINKRKVNVMVIYKNHKTTPTYISWHCMKDRCLNPKSIGYKYYGAKGITVCEQWLRFNGFFAGVIYLIVVLLRIRLGLRQ